MVSHAASMETGLPEYQLLNSISTSRECKQKWRWEEQGIISLFYCWFGWLSKVVRMSQAKTIIQY